eukprot:SAG31_NODE_5256_length_2647_cov_1.875981_4_plen_126_part_00
MELASDSSCDDSEPGVLGLTGSELATENMRIGWEEVVDLMADEGHEAPDFETERAMSDLLNIRAHVLLLNVARNLHGRRSAARTKRMAKILGDDAKSSLAFLQTTEQVDKGPAGPTSLGILESGE